MSVPDPATTPWVPVWDTGASGGGGASPNLTGDYKISAQSATHADPTGGTWYLCDGSATVGAALIALVGPTLPDSPGRTLVMKGTHPDVDTIGDNEGANPVANRRSRHRTTNALAGGGQTGTVSADHTHSGTTGNEKQQHNHSWLSGYDVGNDSQNSTYRGKDGNQTGYITSGVENQAHQHDFTTGGISANHTHTDPAPGGSIGTNVGTDALDTPAFVVPGNLFIHS